MQVQAESVDSMYRRYTSFRIWQFIRHRSSTRNLFYALVFLICIYLLRWTTYQEPLRIEVDVKPPHTWEEIAAKVQRAFLHAYHGYERYAAPHDELRPLSNGYSDKFNGWGVSVYDALDTILIMDLRNEYSRAVQIIQQTNFSLPEGKIAPYFETVIRYLGGALSAYALSGNQLFLDRADELATKLDPVFNTTSGLALFGVNPTSGETFGPEIGILAEIASLQLEYSYLAKLTGKDEHFNKSKTLFKTFEGADLRKTGGMLPTKWNLSSAQPYDVHVSVGAQADSAHEYLLKHYLMTAKADKASLIMYLRATIHIITNLLYLSPTRQLLYVTDLGTDSTGTQSPTHIFEHLSCFLPGLLALGVHTLPLDSLESMGIRFDDIDMNGQFGDARKNYEMLMTFNLSKLHLWAAEGIAQTCWLTYADQPSGLGPDEVLMNTAPMKKVWDAQANYWRAGIRANLWIDAMNNWKKHGSHGIPPGLGDKKPVIYKKASWRGHRIDRDYSVRKTEYLLRPETVESFFILWRVTGDPVWRERGLKIFEALEKEAKTSSGYSSLKSVERSPAPRNDDMPSYFLAETLKYLYLLFINEDPIPLDKWVFNTEAHPFPVFEWTPAERQKFSI